ncbi:DUF3862 domain-containing protein [Caldicoprobacter algeriensis]|uniref:DUF3862 domain-containing protein n=1 Tax=Caldicoprobacter algeriensis TaxID=699281 RepID=UPI002079EE9D|nr:DUF3862 domain-containing protein [Caldicoprobacter algeriensis]MCM8901330.1 DUF3862 domain-containing protein [Caldicoprobacter algeriensis]
MAKEKKPLYKRVWFWAIVVVIAIIAIASSNNKGSNQISVQPNPSNTAQQNTEVQTVTKTETKKYTMDQFKQIKMGMTYEEVKAILGEGTEDSSSGEGELKTVSYSWANSDGSNISVILQGGKVITKAQAGLQSMDARVTMEKYNKIQNGMTYEEVEAILGEGQLISESQIMDQRTEIYTWINSDGSNMNVTFQNGKVEAKAQFGLK